MALAWGVACCDQGVANGWKFALIPGVWAWLYLGGVVTANRWVCVTMSGAWSKVGSGSGRDRQGAWLRLEKG